MKVLFNLLLILLLTACMENSDVDKMQDGGDKGQGQVNNQNNQQVNIDVTLLTLTPVYTTTAPSSTVQLNAVGGTPPYVYSVQSGFGAINASSGLFTAAGSTGSTVIKVTDNVGQTAFSNILVTNNLSLSPANANMEVNDTYTFVASGGTAPYIYSVASGGGSIDNATGVYTAPAASGNAVIQVTDAVGATATSNMLITDEFILDQDNYNLQIDRFVTITTTGGVPPVTYTIYNGNGTIDANTGFYTAPSAPEDVVIRATDSLGNTADGTIHVLTGPTLEAPRYKLLPDSQITVSSSTGVPPFTYTILSGGGTLNPTTGEFKAPSDVDNVTIRVLDANFHQSVKVFEVFTPKEFASVGQYSCFATRTSLNSSDIYCYGENNIYGAIGSADAFIGDELTDMGDSLIDIEWNPGRYPLRIVGNVAQKLCAIYDDYSLKCWGYGSYGANGTNSGMIGDRATSMIKNTGLVKLPTGRSVKSTGFLDRNVALALYGGCAIVDTGEVYCWGWNNTTGTVGIGTATVSYSTPQLVPLGAGRTAVEIVGGNHHHCVLLDDQTVKCWGQNNYGQLGLGDTVVKGNTPGTRVEVLPVVNLNGTVRHITAGTSHNCAILTNDEIKCWGWNNLGQLGNGSLIDVGGSPLDMGVNLLSVNAAGTSGKIPVKLEAGYNNTCVLFDDQTVRCWGSGSYGINGTGNANIIGDQLAEMGDNLIDLDFGPGVLVDDISLGYQHACVHTTTNGMKCWGQNASGELGHGDRDTYVGRAANEMGNSLPFVDLPSGNNAKSIVAGNQVSCAIYNDNNATCWGTHINYGMLNSKLSAWGDDPDEVKVRKIDFGTKTSHVKQMTQGYLHTCALFGDGTARCWGYGAQGQKGICVGNITGRHPDEMGDNIPDSDLGAGVKILQMDARYRKQCWVLDNGTAKCTGQISYGDNAFGNGNFGNSAGTCGDNTPVADIGSGLTVVKVAVGYHHTCFLLDDGRVKCVGRNHSGQLGLGDTEDRDTPAEFGDALPFVNLGSGRTAVDICDHDHANCALLDNGKIKCWGQNSYGALGNGDNTGSKALIGDEPGEMGDNLDYVDLGSDFGEATQLSCNYWRACAINNEGKMKCWGYGGSAQTGYQTTANFGDEPGEMGDNLPYVNVGNRKIVKVYAEVGQTCVVFENNEIGCWGRNDKGQLGVGNGYSLGYDGLSMGDNIFITPLDP
jgi:alpha-tubulin suppressor-like RCC1 family protein